MHPQCFQNIIPYIRMRQSDVYKCANDNKGRLFRHIELPSREEGKLQLQSSGYPWNPWSESQLIGLYDHLDSYLRVPWSDFIRQSSEKS